LNKTAAHIKAYNNHVIP